MRNMVVGMNQLIEKFSSRKLYTENTEDFSFTRVQENINELLDGENVKKESVSAILSYFNA